MHVQTQQVGIQRLAQAVDPLHLAAPLLHLGIVGLIQMNTVAPGILGRVTGAVRRAEQHVEAEHLRLHRHQANAHANGKGLALPTEAILLHQRANTLDNRDRLFQRAAAQQQTKLVTAQTRQHI